MKKVNSVSISKKAVTGTALRWIPNKNMTYQIENLLSLHIIFSKTADEEPAPSRTKMETSGAMACWPHSLMPVNLPKCNRQWQSEIKAVRPNSHTHYWSRDIYWYRNWTRGQQTLEHSCYFMKGLAMSHSRSAKLKRYLITPESKGPL